MEVTCKLYKQIDYVVAISYEHFMKKLITFLSLITQLSSFALDRSCPISQYNDEIEIAQQNGLRVLNGKEVDWNSLKCDITESDWSKSSASGIYCRKSNVILIREGVKDFQSTTFHEFQHYKNNPQIHNLNGIHPYDLFDEISDKAQLKKLTFEELELGIQIVLTILWDEILAFQLDIACSLEDRFSFDDDFVLLVLESSYVPRFFGMKINNELLETVYNRAKITPNLDKFLSNEEIITISNQLFMANITLTSKI